MKVWVVPVFAVLALATSAEGYTYGNCEDFCEGGSLTTRATCVAESVCQWDDGRCWSAVGASPCTGSAPPQRGTGRSCADVCPANANYYEVQCGWFNKKNDDKFCTSPLYRNKLCCDYTSDDCCVPHGGRIAWIVSCIVIITLSSIAGCYFSKSCCFQYRRAQSAPVVFMAPPPGVQMQQMGFPQQGYVQQGTYPQQGYVQQGTSPEQGQAPCQPVAAPPP